MDVAEVPVDRLPRILEVQPLDPESGERGLEHKRRRNAVVKRRRYYDGTAYYGENLSTAEELAKKDRTFDLRYQRLPEHHRLHAYSEHVFENVNFLADQITGQMVIRAEADGVEEWIEATLKRSRLTYRRQEIAREILIAGDVMALCLPAPHPEEKMPQMVWHLWEAETVEIDYYDEDWTRIREVRTEEHRFMFDDGKEVEKRVVNRYFLEPVEFLTDEEGLPVREITEDDDELELGMVLMECVHVVEWDGEERERQRLGVPFIPWVHLHGEGENLRTMYGSSAISFQLMETVDRLNAVNQLEFLAVRYNSFGTLAVAGDEAYLRERQSQPSTDNAAAYTVHKDVADAIVFPGGTMVVPITLSINVEAFVDQREILINEAYGLMGLERIDPKQIDSFGGVSGYALEILNRKTDGSFRRIVENVREGILEMVDLGLQVHAYADAEVDEFGGRRWWTVNVDEVWPNREVSIDFGTAYIVDEVAVRADFIANLISRKEALRRRGYNDDDIEQIEQEITDQQEAADASFTAAIEQGTRFSTERS